MLVTVLVGYVGLLSWTGSEVVKLLQSIVGLGIDTLRLDHGASKDFAAYVVLLKANKYQVGKQTSMPAASPSEGALSGARQA